MRAGVAAAAMVCLCCAGPASASHPAGPPASGGVDPPADPSPGPSISGSAVDGQILTANLGTWEPGTDLSIDWLSCDTAGTNCVLTHDIDSSYTLGPADVGSKIILRVRGIDPTPVVGGFKDADSVPTEIVAAIPPTNTALPQISGIARQGEILSGSNGSWNGTQPLAHTRKWERCDPACNVLVGTTSGYAPGGGSAGATTLRRLSPFPVIAIGGRVVGRGAVVSQLRVSRAPRGATVSVTCKGRSCPFKRARYKVKRRSGLRIMRLERRLRSGTVIVLIVRKGNTIGKYTRLRIRRGAPPARIDRCIRPGARRPSACPG